MVFITVFSHADHLVLYTKCLLSPLREVSPNVPCHQFSSVRSRTARTWPGMQIRDASSISGGLTRCTMVLAPGFLVMPSPWVWSGVSLWLWCAFPWELMMCWLALRVCLLWRNVYSDPFVRYFYLLSWKSSLHILDIHLVSLFVPKPWKHYTWTSPSLMFRKRLSQVPGGVGEHMGTQSLSLGAGAQESTWPLCSPESTETGTVLPPRWPEQPSQLLSGSMLVDLQIWPQELCDIDILLLLLLLFPF